MEHGRIRAMGISRSVQMEAGIRLLAGGAGGLLLALGAHILWWQRVGLSDPWPGIRGFLHFRTIWPVLVLVLGALMAWLAAQPVPTRDARVDRMDPAPGRSSPPTQRNEGEASSLLAAVAMLTSIFLALAARLINLDGLPAFVDEAAYVVLARVAGHGHPWLGLEHGGKLLYVWLSAMIAPIFEDALLGARVVSAVMGGIGAGMVYWLGRELYGRRVAVLAGVLYAINPLAVVNDRMGYMEGTLSTLYVASLASGVATVLRPSSAMAALYGTCIGLAALAKAPGLLGLLFPPAIAVALRREGTHLLPARLWGWIYAPALLLASPSLWSLRKGFVWSFTSLAGTAEGGWWALWLRNGRWLAEWLGTYWTIPVLVLGGWTILVGARRRDRSVLLLGSAALVPVLTFAALGKIWFPRYLVFATGPWLVLVACGLSRLMAGADRAAYPWILRIGGVFALGILLGVPALRIVAPVIWDVRAAPLPVIDRWQYVEGWPSGYGLPETIGFLQPEVDRSLSELAVVIDRERSSNFIFGLSLYAKRRPPLAVHLIDRTLRRPGDPGAGAVRETPGGYVAVHAFDLKDPATVPALRVLAGQQRTYILLSYDQGDPFGPQQAGAVAQPLSKEISVLQLAGARRLRVFSKPGPLSHYEVWGIGRTAG